MSFTFATFLLATLLAIVYGQCSGTTNFYVNFTSGTNTRIQGVLASQACLNIYEQTPSDPCFGLMSWTTENCPFCAGFSITAVFDGPGGPYNYYCETGSTFSVLCKTNLMHFVIQCTNTFSNCNYDFEFLQNNLGLKPSTCAAPRCSSDVDSASRKKKISIAAKDSESASMKSITPKLPSCNGCYVQYGSDAYACCNGMSIYNGQCSCKGGPCTPCIPSPLDKKKVLA